MLSCYYPKADKLDKADKRLDADTIRLHPINTEPPNIIPSLTNLSILLLAIPPPIRKIPIAAKPRELMTIAALKPVKSVLNMKIIPPIQASKIPSNAPNMINVFENNVSSNPPICFIG